MAAYVRFPSTFWTTLIQRPERGRVEVFARYRVPVFNFLRNRGLSEHDADDVTQEVFMRVCREDFLKRLDREKGKFRSLLLAITRHVMLKDRDARRKHNAASIEQGGPNEGALQLPDKQEPDRAYNEDWIKNLVQIALQQLQVEGAEGGPKYYDALVMSKLQGLPYAQISERLGATLTDVTNWIHQAKERFKRHLRQAVQDYSSSEEEYREELALIGKLLK